MSHIDDLITDLCPDGVEYRSLGELVDRVKKVKWSDLEGMELEYVDLTSVDRTTHTITYTEAINAGTAPQRAQQLVRQGDVLFGTTRPLLQRYCSVPAEYDGQVASSGFCVLRPIRDAILPRFLFHLLGTTPFYTFVERNQRGASYPAISDKVVKSFCVPVPPLEVQAEIVRVLDKFVELEVELGAEMEARQQQFEFYRNELLTPPKEDGFEWSSLGEIATNHDSRRKPITKSARVPGTTPYYGASGIVDFVDGYIFDGDYLLISEDGANLLARSTPIAFSVSGRMWVNNHAHVLEFKEYATRRFVEFYLNATDISRYVSTAAQPKLNQSNLNRLPIPLPSLPEQKRVVEILDRFDLLVNDLSSGLPAEITARRKQYEYYMDRLLTFDELTS